MVDSPPLALAYSADPEAWARAVLDGRIESSRAATDAAMVEAVLGGLPPGGRVLDVGCGEGWLSRAFGALGASVHGIDAAPELIAAAESTGGATFDCLGYAEAAADPERLGGPYDAAVFNFSILDRRARDILRVTASRLEAGGRLLIQTVHPATVAPPYTEGWRAANRTSSSHTLDASAEWYFRPFGTWVRELDAAGLGLCGCVEPLDDDQLPISMILIAQPLAG